MTTPQPNSSKVYLAVDLGAGSGRLLAAHYDGSTLQLEEIHRFENQPIQLPDGWHWDITGIYQNLLTGLRIAAQRYRGQPVSIGIDTWGVDYALLDREGRLLGVPYQYRDSRTDGMIDLADQRVGLRRIYEATGIQFMFFNSIFQLLSEVERKSPALKAAEHLLFLPDLFGYWLTGQMRQELSICSTSQLLNPRTRQWEADLLAKLDIPAKLFREVTLPGTPLGPLTEAAQQTTGLQMAGVTSIAGHDTASAVAAVPSIEKCPAYLSSGTWSLMGIELPSPVINDQSHADAFTNEMGIGGTIRFLKNICGLWLLQESRRDWASHGEDLDYASMAPLAHQSPAFRSMINPDDPRFSTPGPMPERIQAFCRETSQPIPESKGQIIRCIYESLALRYAQVWEKLIQYAPAPPPTLHIVGGGCQDELLNQFTANALQVPIIAGPVEATGYGNILAQLLADGRIEDLAEGRQLIRRSVSPKEFFPAEKEAWSSAISRFNHLTSKPS
ncbi:MAG: rhamnulokinase family protein [Puniceicoccaceae bacterium]